jgi:uncharacterized membrane protein
MAQCAKCGSPVADGVKFCGACGSSSGPEANAPLSPASPASPPEASGSAGGIPANVASMLVYLPLCFIGLVCAILFGFVLDPYKQNRLIRFHAWHSIALHVAFVAFWIAWTIFSLILTSVIHFLAIITVPISMLVGLGALVLMVILMIKAYGGDTLKVPFISDWAEKQAGN